MNNDLWSMLSKKRHKTFDHGHKEYEEFPVIFSPYQTGNVPKNILKINRKLKLEKTEGIKMFKAKARTEEDKFLLARSLNLGYYLVIPLLMGIFLGYWLDKIFSTKPFFLLVLFALGVISSFYNLWKTVKTS